MYRLIFAWMGKCWQWVSSPDLKNSSRYQAACQWLEKNDQLHQFPCLDGEHPHAADLSKIAIEHTTAEYAEACKAIEIVETKAEKLLLFTATIIGIVSASIRNSEQSVSLWTSIGLGLLLASCLAFLICRKPCEMPGLSSGKLVIDMLTPQTAHPHNVQILRAGAMFTASIGNRVVADWKSDRLSCGHWLFLPGLVFIVWGVLSK